MYDHIIIIIKFKFTLLSLTLAGQETLCIELLTQAVLHDEWNIMYNNMNYES